jgi:SAM-dependent methyltransferase
MIYDKAFLNWGLWDKKICKEYQELNFNFSKICAVQDIYSQLLIYCLIRPLVQAQFFNKRLLDVGCGNGIGLKVGSELLQTEYALGVDLVNKLVTNSNGNFYLSNRINYIQSDAENLALENESFDIITNLESSHLYPKLERFFSEIERVLAPGGYFCYSDIYITKKCQTQRLERFVKTKKNLRIVQKIDFTKMVQDSIYNRLVVYEDIFYEHARAMFGEEENKFFIEASSLARAMGLTFLPWWKIRFKKPALRSIAKSARKDKYWGKKYFFYYLIQKVE